MTSKPAQDYTHLPPSVPIEDTVAQQLERDRYSGGGAGGGDDSVGGLVADGDGD